MSNSAINKYIVAGSTGNIGPAGQTGPQGPAGSAGAAGAKGSDGAYITSASSNTNGFIFNLSNGNQFTINGNFAGATLEDKITNVDNLSGAGYTLLQSISAGIMSFRGLSATGSLVVEQGQTYIDIRTIYNEGKGSLNPAVVDNTLLYLESPTTANSTTVNAAIDPASGLGILDFDKTDAFLNDRVSVKYYGPIERGQVTGINGELENFPPPGTSSGIYLDLSAAGVHVLRTPIGISGFTGIQNNVMQSTVLVFESDDVWKFPNNVFFEDGENYLTCGKTIVNIQKFKPNENVWLAKVAARGLDINFNSVDANGNRIRIQDLCLSSSLYGSCCSRNSLDQPVCSDYVTARDCSDLFGTFHPNKNCSESCGVTFGACCSAGKCVDDATFDECQYFGGRFWKGITCGTIPNNPDGLNYAETITDGKLCFGGCEDNTPSACCKDGYCLGDNFTRIECELLLQGISIKETPCENANCCSLNIGKGACCTEAECIDDNSGGGLTPKQCRDINGVYMGEGSLCSQVNCDCVSFPDVIAEIPAACGGDDGGGGGGGGTRGACCYILNGNSQCAVVTSDECTQLNGTYQGDNSICTPNPCDDGGGGGGGGDPCIKKCSDTPGLEQLCNDNGLPLETKLKTGAKCEICTKTDGSTYTRCLEFYGAIQYEQSPGTDIYLDFDLCQEDNELLNGDICRPIGTNACQPCKRCNGTGSDVATCANDPIPTGACCRYSLGSGGTSWTCSQASEAQCTAQGGEYKGDDTICSSVNCSDSTTTGACCQESFSGEEPTYTCTLNRTVSQCANVNGTWYPNETSCPESSPCGADDADDTRDCSVYGGDCFFDVIGDHHPADGVRYINGFWAPRPSGFDPTGEDGLGRYYVPGDSKCVGQSVFLSSTTQCAVTNRVYRDDGDASESGEIVATSTCLTPDIVSEGIAWMMSLYGNLSGLVDEYGDADWGDKTTKRWPEGSNIYTIFTKEFTQDHFLEFLDEYKNGEFSNSITWATAIDPDFPALALQLRMMAKSSGPGDAAWRVGALIGGNDLYSIGNDPLVSPLPNDWIQYYRFHQDRYDPLNPDTHLGTCCNYKLTGECYIVTRKDCIEGYNTYVDTNDDNEIDVTLERQPYIPGTNQVWRGTNYVASPGTEYDSNDGFKEVPPSFYTDPRLWEEKVVRDSLSNYCNACAVDQKYPARSWAFGNIWEIYSPEKLEVHGYTLTDCGRGIGINCPTQGPPFDEGGFDSGLDFYNSTNTLDDQLYNTQYGPQGSTGALPITGCFGEYSYIETFGEAPTPRQDYAYSTDADGGWCCWCEETACTQKIYPQGAGFGIDRAGTTYGAPGILDYTPLVNGVPNLVEKTNIENLVKETYSQYGCTDCVKATNILKRVSNTPGGIDCSNYLDDGTPFRNIAGECAWYQWFCNNQCYWPCNGYGYGYLPAGDFPSGYDRPGADYYMCRRYVNTTAFLISSSTATNTPRCDNFNTLDEITTGGYISAIRPTINNQSLAEGASCRTHDINHGPGFGNVYEGRSVIINQYSPQWLREGLASVNISSSINYSAIGLSPEEVGYRHWYDTRDTNLSFGFAGFTCGMINPWTYVPTAYPGSTYNPYRTSIGGEHLDNISGNALLRCYCRRSSQGNCKDFSAEYPKAQYPNLWTTINGKDIFLGRGPKTCTKCGCGANGQNCRTVSPNHPIQPDFTYNGERIGEWYHNTEWIGKDIVPRFYPNTVDFDTPYESGGLPRSGGKRWFTLGFETQPDTDLSNLIRSDFTFTPVTGYRDATIYNPNNNSNYPGISPSSVTKDVRRLAWDNCMHWLSGSTYGQTNFKWGGRRNYKWTLRELVNLRSRSLLEQTNVIGYYGTPHLFYDIDSYSETRSKIWPKTNFNTNYPENLFTDGTGWVKPISGFQGYDTYGVSIENYEIRTDMKAGYQVLSGLIFNFESPFFEFNTEGIITHPIVPLNSRGNIPSFQRTNGTLGEIRFNYPCKRSAYHVERKGGFQYGPPYPINKIGAEDWTEYTGFCNNWRIITNAGYATEINSICNTINSDGYWDSKVCTGKVNSLWTGCGGTAVANSCCCNGQLVSDKQDAP